jgi:hypothetical protein
LGFGAPLPNELNLGIIFPQDDVNSEHLEKLHYLKIGLGAPQIVLSRISYNALLPDLMKRVFCPTQIKCIVISDGERMAKDDKNNYHENYKILKAYYLQSTFKNKYNRELPIFKYNSRYKMPEKLINSGVDINAKDNNNCTALINACKKCVPHMAEYLLNLEGIDLEAKEKLTRKTALNYAKANGLERVAKKIEDKMIKEKIRFSY